MLTFDRTSKKAAFTLVSSVQYSNMVKLTPAACWLVHYVLDFLNKC